MSTDPLPADAGSPAHPNLFLLAERNADAIQQQFVDLVAAAHPASRKEVLSRFAAYVESRSRLSINMLPGPLIRFLAMGWYPNVHDEVAYQADATGRAVDDLYLERIRSRTFVALRRAFDGCFDQGMHFVYAAMNCGGPGMTTFGDFCVAFSDSLIHDTAHLAYLPDDSLRTYVSGRPPVVDVGAVGRAVAPHRHRHHLATLKHSADFFGHPDDIWPVLLCSGRKGIEAVLADRPRTADIAEVRLEAARYDYYFGLAVAPDPTPADIDRGIEFLTILKHLDTCKRALVRDVHHA